MSNTKRILWASIGINIIFSFILGVVFLKFSVVSSGIFNSSAKAYNENPFYIERTTLFNELRIPEKSTVFLGDSLTQRSQWDEFFPEENIVNRGIGSDTTEGIISRLDEIVASKPSKVFIMAGINDLSKKMEISKIVSNYSAILDRLKAQSPNTVVYIQSVLPVNNKIYGNLINNNDVFSLNAELKILAKKSGYEYNDLTSALSKDNQLVNEFTVDGIHLTGKGYKVWADTISSKIKE